jgi:hypothetical protein
MTLSSADTGPNDNQTNKQRLILVIAHNFNVFSYSELVYNDFGCDAVHRTPLVLLGSSPLFVDCIW